MQSTLNTETIHEILPSPTLLSTIMTVEPSLWRCHWRRVTCEN